MKKIQNYLFYIYCFSINFELWDPLNTHIDFLFTKITAVLYLLSLLINYKLFFSFKKFKKILYPIWLLFLLLVVMNYRSINVQYSEIIDIPFLLNILIFHAAINHNKRESGIVIKGLFVFASSSIILTLMYFLGYETSYTIENRITIFGYNQNELGIKLSISILIIYIMLRHNKINIRKSKLLYYISIPFIFIFLTQTGSRAAFLAILTGISFYYLFYGKLTLKKVFRTTFIFIGFIAVWLFFLKDSYIVTRLTAFVNEGDLSGRDVRWASAIDVFLNNPFWGMGKNGYSEMIESYLGFNSSPHNVFIEILVYTGIIGFIVFSLFILRLSLASYTNWKNNNDYLSLLFLAPVFAVLLSGQILGSKIIWLIFAYIVSIKFESTQKKEVINNRLIQ